MLIDVLHRAGRKVAGLLDADAALHGTALDGVSIERLDDRKNLLRSVDRLRRDMDAKGTMDGVDAFTQQAFNVLTSSKLLEALDLAFTGRGNRGSYLEVRNASENGNTVYSGVLVPGATRTFTFANATDVLNLTAGLIVKSATVGTTVGATVDSGRLTAGGAVDSSLVDLSIVNTGANAFARWPYIGPRHERRRAKAAICEFARVIRRPRAGGHAVDHATGRRP